MWVIPLDDLTDAKAPVFVRVTEPSSQDRQVQVFRLPERVRCVRVLAFNEDKVSRLVKDEKSIDLTVSDPIPLTIYEPDSWDVFKRIKLDEPLCDFAFISDPPLLGSSLSLNWPER